MSRKERGRGIIGIEDNVDESIRRLEWFIEKDKERLILTASSSTDKMKTNRNTIIKKQKLYGCFKWQTHEISHGHLDMDTEKKLSKRYLISFNSSTKQRQKEKNMLKPKSIMCNRTESVD